VSFQKRANVIYPTCHQSFFAQIWMSVNVNLSPELKEKVLDKSLNQIYLLIEKARSFAAQLIAYRTALEKATGIPVLNRWIHFSLSGYLVNVAANASAETFLKRRIAGNRITNS
jgi:hypothetical protein